MRLGMWSTEELGSKTLKGLLDELESAWGVRVAVAVVRASGLDGSYEAQIVVDLPVPEHQAELCYPPGVVVPLMNERTVPLEAQLVSALAVWTDQLMRHLEDNSRPAPSQQ